MHTKFTKILLLVWVLLFVSPFCVSVDAEEIEPITIDIGYDKTELSINESITATYRITGGSENYETMLCRWQEYSGGTWIDQPSISLTDIAGTVTYTPQMGAKVRFYVYVQDSDNRCEGEFGDDIIVHGAVEVEPVKVEIVYDRAEVEINNSLGATYRITGGNGVFTRIFYTWQECVSGSWLNVGFVYPTASEDTVTYVPSKGSKVRLYVHAEDSDGREGFSFGEEITVKGTAEVEPIEIEIVYDKTEVNANESINATYKVTGGNGNYSKIGYVWQEYSGGTWINATFVYPTSHEGTVSYIPCKGTKVRVWFEAHDSDGRNHSLFGADVTVVPLQIVLGDYPTSIQEGKSFELAPSVSNGMMDTYAYESSDPSILNVDNNGVVMGISQGKAQITINGMSSGLSKIIEVSVYSANTQKLTATMTSPTYGISSSGAGTTYSLSFSTNASGGVSPYTYSYTLYRNFNEIYSANSNNPEFAVTGGALNLSGTYTAKVVVEDVIGQKVTVWSQGYYQRNGTSSSVGSFRMGTPDVDLPVNVTCVESSAFEGTAVAIVYLPDACGSIGSRAFANCPRLTQIRIPKGCIVSDDAFVGCTNLVIFGTKGSPAERYAIDHDNQCIFVAE